MSTLVHIITHYINRPTLFSSAFKALNLENKNSRTFKNAWETWLWWLWHWAWLAINRLWVWLPAG